METPNLNQDRYLDLDIISDILSRLPTKPLIRFKSVSKQWHSLIISPNFIKLHLSKTLISHNRRHLIASQWSLFTSPIPVPKIVFTEVLNPFQHMCVMGDTSLNHLTPTLILGSCNGVVCISIAMSVKRDIVFLFNPSTRTRRLIPHFESCVDKRGCFGFGYDSVNDDYKLVRMIHEYGKGLNSALIYAQVSLYSFESDSWCVIDDVPSFDVCFDTSNGVFVNRALHFIVQCEAGDGSKRMITRFNLQTHTFSFMDLPKEHVTIDRSGRNDFKENSYVLCEFRGCLSVFVKMCVGEKVRVEAWVMKEYGDDTSWFRLFCNDDHFEFDDFFHLNPIVFTEDGERVLLMVRSLWAWYDWGRNRFESFAFRGWRSTPVPFEVSTFVDTLVSFDRKHENH